MERSCLEMFPDYMPATEDVSARLTYFLRENDLRAVELVLLSRGIKTYNSFQQELLNPENRKIMADKSLGIYRLLGGPFPQSRQQALKACFGEDSLNLHMDHDEYSILNCLGGCTEHATELLRSFGPAFTQAARAAGNWGGVSESLDHLARSHELARASLRSAVDAYAAIFCTKGDVRNDVQYEAIKGAHRACKDRIFWGLANVCYGVESKDGMIEAYESIAGGVWCRKHIVETFHKTYTDLTKELAGGEKKSGVWLSKHAAKVMADLAISAKTQGQDAEQADAGLLLQKLLDDADGTKAAAGCSAASASSSESVQEGTCQDKPQTQTQDVTDMLSHLHERVTELERELVFSRVKRVMNPMQPDDDE